MVEKAAEEDGAQRLGFDLERTLVLCLCFFVYFCSFHLLALPLSVPTAYILSETLD